MKRLGLGSFALFGLMLGSSHAALAEGGEPTTANKLQVMGEFQVGFATGGGGAEPYGIGVGVEAGYTLVNALYLGVSFDYFLGDSLTIGSLEARLHTWTAEIEVGYDVPLGESTIFRPKLGIGVHTPVAEFCDDGICDDSYSENHLAVSPAIEVLHNFDPVFIAAEVRFNLDVQAVDGSGLTFGVGVGAAF